MEANEKIISELVKALATMKEKNFQVHTKLLKESQETNKIYIQILSAIRHQNSILDDLKQTDRITVSQ